MLGRCSSLATLDLGCNGMPVGAAGAWSLAGVLGQCSSLTELHLEADLENFANSNEIGSEGGCSLGRVLGQCPLLASLYLGDNYIGDEGATSLAEGLGQWESDDGNAARARQKIVEAFDAVGWSWLRNLTARVTERYVEALRVRAVHPLEDVGAASQGASFSLAAEPTSSRIFS